MAFQSTVNFYNSAGVQGDLAFTGPIRATEYNLNSSGQAQTFGFAFTVTNGGNPDPTTTPFSPNAGTAQVGGTGLFAGILVNPKEHALSGTALSPSLNVPDYAVGSLLNMGEVWVSLAAAANVGDLAYYDNTTGAIGTVPQASSFTGVVATNTLTVSGYVAGGAPLGIGSVISGTGVTPGTVISALGTGTGGNGTYTVTGAATVASTTMKGTAVAPTGKTLIPNAQISHFDATAAGLAVLKLTN